MVLVEQEEARAGANCAAVSQPSARERILDAAQQCFRQSGYAGTTIAQVAACARLTRRTLYKYYPDKRAIWLDATREVAGRIATALRPLASARKPLGDRLAALLLAASLLLRRHALEPDIRTILILRGDAMDDWSVDPFSDQLWGEVADLLSRDGEMAVDLTRNQLIAWLTAAGSALAVARSLDGMTDARLQRMTRSLLVPPLLRSGRVIQPVDELVACRTVPVRLNALRADPSAPPLVREKIVEAALERFSQPGGQDFTIADVAADVAVDRRTVYRHFADRQALIEQVALLEARRVNSQIRRLLVRRPDPADIVADGILLSILIFDASPLKAQLIAGTEVIASASDHDRKIFPFVRDQWQHILRRMTELRSTNPDLTVDAMAAWLLLMQHVLHRSLDLTGSDPAAIRIFIRRFVVDPLVATPDSPGSEGKRP